MNNALFIWTTLLYSVLHLMSTYVGFAMSWLLSVRLKLSKCSFACTEVAYLGHIVSTNGITPDPQKVAAVLQFPQPTEAKPLKQFLGLTDYYRKFIHNYASIAELLHQPLKSHKKFQWTPSCQQAFNFLKSKLTSPPILGYPDFSQFILMRLLMPLVLFSANFNQVKRLLSVTGAVSYLKQNGITLL